MLKELLAEAYPIIERAAPAIAQALGGPVMNVAITAASLLMNKFGVKDLTQIASNILSDPEAELKLQESDLDFANEMIKATARSVGQLASLEAQIKIAWKD